MRLQSLELQGFKTFPDKTKLTFDHGISAVVGPNGSGKSNISDAMRWVLGEQSSRVLRCSKMEDIVFNGTPSRRAQGFAQVTLTIDNRSRALNFDGDTVAITRRYYRSGESEYQINHATVRLKDVHELFMDTGLGRTAIPSLDRAKSTAWFLPVPKSGGKFLRKQQEFPVIATEKKSQSGNWLTPRKICFAFKIL